jgi:hypothetical protein
MKFLKGQYKLNLKNTEENIKQLQKCADKLDKDDDIAYSIGSPDNEDELYMDFRIEAHTINECRAKRNYMRNILKEVCNYTSTLEMEGSCLV